VRILHFIYDSPGNPWVGGGGAGRVFQIDRILADRGHEIRLVMGAFPDCHLSGKKFGNGEGPEEIFIGSEADSYLWSTMAYTVASWKKREEWAEWADILIEDFAPWNPVFSCSNRAGKPAILQIQNFLGREIPRKYPVIGHPLQWFERWYPSRFRHRVYVNGSLRSAYGLEGTVIPMGVEPQALEIPILEGDYVAFLGRIDAAQKGLDLLIEAFEGLIDIPLKIAGRGPDEEKLRRRSANLDHVSWIGPVHGQAKWDFLSRARFVVIPSRFEGQPLVALEAAAAGRMILASDIRELDFITSEGIGRQVSARDLTGFREALRDCWTDLEMRQSAGTRGRQFASTRTWDAIAADFEKTCEEIIACSYRGH
jgi:glycosyltransferase involved in cell wall biosynthesis